MDKRWLIVIIVTLGFLIGYQLLVAGPEQAKRAQEQQAAAAAAAEAARQDAAQAPKPAAAAAAPIAPDKTAALQSRPPEQVVQAKGDEYRAMFSSYGGMLKSYTMESYKNEQGGPIELIDVRRPEDYALGLTFDGGNLALPIAAPYSVETADKGFSFRWSDGKYVEVTRTYILDKRKHSFELEVTLRNLSAGELRGTPVMRINGFRAQQQAGGGCMSGGCGGYSDGRSLVAMASPKALLNEELLEETDEEVMATRVGPLQGKVQWFAIDRHYFTVAAGPSKGDPQALVAYQLRPDRVLVGEMRLPEVVLAPGASETLGFLVFAGPKRMDLLQAAGRQLDRSIDFGWFWFLSQPMLWLMKWFQSFVGNFGIAIILLTIVVKLLLLPITQRMYRSMNKMKKLQPKIAEIKERLGEDKEAIQREQMELYKREGVNPLGGCLPMFIQMPVYIALWRALFSAVELYQEPLGLWIQDMSAPDPYYVFPILLVVTMFISQRMTPTAVDSAQAKMMQYTMPIMFGFFMFMLPAGLVLYILANSLLQIVHQLWMLKMPEPEDKPGGKPSLFSRLMDRTMAQSEEMKKLKDMEQQSQKRREDRAKRLADRRGRGAKKK